MELVESFLWRRWGALTSAAEEEVENSLGPVGTGEEDIVNKIDSKFDLNLSAATFDCPPINSFAISLRFVFVCGRDKRSG